MKKINLLTLSLFFLISPIAIHPALAKNPDRPQLEVSQTAQNRENDENRAQELYELGRYSEAVTLLEKLAEDYAREGDVEGQALSLRNLSLVYQEMGDWTNARTAISESLALLETLQNPDKTNQANIQNIVALNWESLGQVELMTGNSEAALANWETATEMFEVLENVSGSIRNQVNQVQALESLGLYRQGLKTLEMVNARLQAESNNMVKGKSLQVLGDALRAIGDLEQSQSILEEALAIAERFNDSEAIGSTLFSLANTVRLQGNTTRALNLYEQAKERSAYLPLELHMALYLNQLNLLVEAGTTDDLSAEIAEIQFIFNQLPVSRVSVDSKINLAGSLIQLAQQEAEEFGEPISTNFSEIANLLAIAIQEAQRLNNPRAEAYALGNLGYLYEQNQQWSEALNVTDRALFLTQSIQAADITYQWEWQRGRILQQQGDRAGAIGAYTRAVNILESLRTDLVSISSDAQFSFRESVEPVYRELVGLLLTEGQEVSQAELVQARQVIESLQIAELDNFFRDACLDLKPAQIDKIDPTAAVFYTIILKDSQEDINRSRLEVIVAIPGQPLQRYRTNMFSENNNIDDTIEALRTNLLAPKGRRFRKERYVQPLAEVYDWLIRPIEPNLAANDIQTLVFVLDGQLRNVPMSSLYDGQQFLIENYSVAIAPSLQLIDPKPLVSLESSPVAFKKLQILTAGLSEARQGFSPLPGVELELDRITAELPAERLFNESFTQENFKLSIDEGAFSIVHLATHGEFSSKAEDTFVLTWDDRLNANELDNFLRNKSERAEPIELLVLSACQTAVGDDRAVLGLAGVAVRAGARSTLASLWYVSDEATTLLMTKFYQEVARSLRQEGNPITKAQALREAQLEVLSSELFSHPYYWAAFVLVGNWL